MSRTTKHRGGESDRRYRRTTKPKIMKAPSEGKRTRPPRIRRGQKGDFHRGNGKAAATSACADHAPGPRNRKIDAYARDDRKSCGAHASLLLDYRV